MRNEQEMFNLILGVAKQDERIRAVYMNGSRANPNVPKDIFQDYDIVYVVTETDSFLQDKDWIKVFGEPIVMQEPDYLDKIQGRKVDFSKGYTYLMQFTDGNRIDLHIQTKVTMLEEYKLDKLTVPLLDKDDCLPKVPTSTDKDYWVKKPTEGQFFSRCNNFWWVAPYCAKGLWRNEILFTLEVMNSHVRQDFMTMLSWYAGIKTDFKVSMGKAYKYINHYIEPELWDKLLVTHATGDYESTWNALFTLCEAFEEVATSVATTLGYSYNSEEATRSFEFIKHIKDLPADAKEIY